MNATAPSKPAPPQRSTTSSSAPVKPSASPPKKREQKKPQMALVAAVMSSSLAGYLEKTIKIEASCQHYARALVDRGYETPEMFHTLSSKVLLDSFARALVETERQREQ